MASVGIALHGTSLITVIVTTAGLNLSLGNAASMIGLELALIALIATIVPTLRGMSAGLLILAALAATMTGGNGAPGSASVLAGAADPLHGDELIWGKAALGV